MKLTKKEQESALNDWFVRICGETRRAGLRHDMERQRALAQGRGDSLADMIARIVNNAKPDKPHKIFLIGRPDLSYEWLVLNPLFSDLFDYDTKVKAYATYAAMNKPQAEAA